VAVSEANDKDYTNGVSHEEFHETAMKRLYSFATDYSNAVEAEIVSAYTLSYSELVDLLNGDWEKIILSGSAYSVNDKIEWVQNLIDAIIDTAVETRAPIFGICFGAQVLAKANGGTVSKIPNDEFRKGKRTLVAENGVLVPIYVSNTEFIKLKDIGEVIADIDGMPEIVRFGKDVGTQYHPEVPLTEV